LLTKIHLADAGKPALILGKSSGMGVNVTDMGSVNFRFNPRQRRIRKCFLASHRGSGTADNEFIISNKIFLTGNRFSKGGEGFSQINIANSIGGQREVESTYSGKLAIGFGQ